MGRRLLTALSMMSLKLRADRSQLSRRNQRKTPRKRRLMIPLSMMSLKLRADRSQLSRKTKEESKEEKAADSFVNDVAEAESRQEPAEQRETQEDSNQDEHKSEGKPGILTVHVIEASNLRNKDIMGKSDPYVEVLFEDT